MKCGKCGCDRVVEGSQYKLCEPCREYNREWSIANAELKREIDHKWKGSHRDERRVYNNGWWKAHPQQYKIKLHNYRARKRGNGGKLPHNAEAILFEQQEGFCYYCGELLYSSFVDYFHLEHKTPVSRGGSSDISNIVLSCATCNYKKGTKTHEEYLQSRNA